jgi:sulfur carrier protein
MSTAATESVNIVVNDEPRAIAGDSSVATLARELGVAERKGVAIAVNGSVVTRAGWNAHRLADGDRVLVIRATQGG